MDLFLAPVVSLSPCPLVSSVCPLSSLFFTGFSLWEAQRLQLQRSFNYRRLCPVLFCSVLSILLGLRKSSEASPPDGLSSGALRIYRTKY